MQNLLKVSLIYTHIQSSAPGNATAPATAHGVGAELQYEGISMVLGSVEQQVQHPRSTKWEEK